MSVVVRMEMPISCYDCEIRDGKAYCPICGATLVGYKRSRHENCPILCQLPEGHGDLIDRNKLLGDIEMYHVSDGCFQHWAESQDAVIPAETESI